jgi:mRNA interferase RelE/StbE
MEICIDEGRLKELVKEAVFEALKDQRQFIYERDLKGVKDKSLLKEMRQVIEEVEAAGTLNSISHLRKLPADGSCFRIRLGEYRMGLIVEGDLVTFVRFLHGF